MSARLLGVAAGLRRALPATAARAPRFLPATTTTVSIQRRAASSSDVALTADRIDGREQKKILMGRARRALVHINDSWVLAKHIDELLAKDQYDQALVTVEMACKNVPTTVSWNHLIDHLLKKQQTRKAMTTYNNVSRDKNPDKMMLSVSRR